MTSTLTKKYSFDTVFDSQKVFRLILEAMSNPARAVNLGEFADMLFGDYPALLAIAMTLLDNEVSFSAYENDSLSAEIISLTLTKRERVEFADFVFVCDPNKLKIVIENIKYGTLTDPHKSATLVIRDDGEPACRLTLRGPGIDGYMETCVSQTARDAIMLRDAQDYEYPQGIDLILVSSAGELIAIPRLTRMEAG
jgi:alpha-D-ribose 1-methylphosphonate 5-triphosphate synthase subunit PhnH